MVKKSITGNNGEIISYRTYGRRSGLPLILIHGFCEDSLLWNPILPALQKNRIVSIDLPGFGSSDAIKSPHIEKYAEAVKRVLLNEQIENCVMLGHSMGGYTALSFLKMYPEYIKGLGLIHSHPFADDKEKVEARNRSINILKSGKQSAYLDMLFPSLFEPTFIEKNQKVLQLLKRRALKFPREGIIGGLEAMKQRKDHQLTLKNSSCPVFYFLGGKDTLLPPIHENKMLSLPDILDLHILPGLGHMGMFESPLILGAAIAEFLTFVAQRN